MLLSQIVFIFDLNAKGLEPKLAGKTTNRSELSSIEELEALIDMAHRDPQRAAAKLESTSKTTMTAGRFGEEVTFSEWQTSGRIEHFIHNRAEACLLVSPTGRISRLNASAQVKLAVEAGQQIEELNLTLPEGESFAVLVKAVSSAPWSERRFQTGRAQIGGNAQTTSFVIAALPGDGSDLQSGVLILLSLREGVSERYDRIYREHGLSPSEVKVVEQFIAGMSLSEIAERRGRSLATVRKQFYTICEKFGVASQAELLRAILTDSSLVEDMRPMLDLSEHPDRVEANILRPGGRVVEVVIAGDRQGIPIIVCPSTVLRTFPASAEHAFKQAGIQVISVMAPGFGKTSPECPGEDDLRVAADDILAVMDQLGLSQAKLLVTNFGMHAALHFARFAQGRLDGIIGASINLPKSIAAKRKSKNRVLAGLQDRLQSKGVISEVAFRTTARALLATRPETALRMTYKGHQKAILRFQSAEIMPETTEAFQSIFAQGLDAGTRAFSRAHLDWEQLVNEQPANITILTGLDSDLYDAAAMRAFADRHPDKVALLDVSKHDFATPFDTVDMIIELMKTNRHRD
ncbi:helix-turn-helix domain-containing protein [Yoonia litorea]|uniref:DNA-binding transcriptional regulator, CsgD family n=1 Tax=Yoonia litorea TaxID=1123755 RepID=A0A1I6LNF5_9RHOB|nr:helix-turn-helix transcriptional regulator [Yoonia litorea]SFS04971.1 DNA-binding transcriptional regulator, CsgD family [Yoonia litorea]